MINTLIVILGAGLGGGTRHGINVAVARLLPGLGFPLATLIINVLGSFLMGVLAEGFALRGAAGHPAARGAQRQMASAAAVAQRAGRLSGAAG